MSEILLRPEEANAEGTHVMTTADAIQETIDNLQQRISGLSSSFKGQTQVAFEQKMLDLQATETQVMLALNGLGQFLIGAAQTLTDVDAEIAGRLNA